jgi:TIR domain
MATLREYFDSDFSHDLNVAKSLGIQFQQFPPIELRARLHLDFTANAKYISCFFPAHPAPLIAINAILGQLNLILDLTKEVEVRAGYSGEKSIGSRELGFTGKIFIYSETDLSASDLQQLETQTKGSALSICLRSTGYAVERSRYEKPLAFICHDSRDKEVIARPIAIGLSELMCPVWYDEFSLKVGDRLRESIEKGLKECKKCVLVLSPQFLGNTGWTRAEFNSIFTRELIEKEDFLLPVWFGVSKEQVFAYSPSLADRVGANWDLGIEEVVRRLYRAIR